MVWQFPWKPMWENAKIEKLYIWIDLFVLFVFLKLYQAICIRNPHTTFSGPPLVTAKLLCYLQDSRHSMPYLHVNLCHVMNFHRSWTKLQATERLINISKRRRNADLKKWDKCSMQLTVYDPTEISQFFVPSKPVSVFCFVCLFLLEEEFPPFFLRFFCQR